MRLKESICRPIYAGINLLPYFLTGFVTRNLKKPVYIRFTYLIEENEIRMKYTSI